MEWLPLFDNFVSKYKRYCDITVRKIDYCCIIHDMNKSEAIHLLDHSVLEGQGYI